MKKYSLTLALVVSLALHAALIFSSLRAAFPFLADQSEQISGDNLEDALLVELAPVEEPRPTPSELDKQFAESEAAGVSVPTDTRFLGKRDHTVDKQTRAAKVDNFSQGRGMDANGSMASNESQRTTPAQDDFGGRPAEELTMKNLTLGNSWKHRTAATDDQLEGIPVGERTALNTRQHRYYAYYERAKNQLRIHWKPEVQRRASKLAVQKKLVDGQQLVTRVVAYLDSDGVVQQVRTSKSSGFEHIDAAATTAFYKVRQIPNVPKGMVDEDGFARLHWEFILNAAEAPSLKLADNKEDWRDKTRRID